MYKPVTKVGPRAKKKVNKAEKISLERIIGCTSQTNAAFSVSPENGDIAYAAGSVVVIYSPRKNKQTHFLLNTEPKAISCLAFSPNGKYLVVGETGHQPAVVVWDASTGQKLSEMRQHKFGVSCVAWSPNLKYVVSVGHHHDGYLFLWDWKSGTPIACNKVTTKVHAVTFSDDGSCFVTAGVRHVKFWSIDPSGEFPVAERAQIGNPKGQSTPMGVVDGRGAVLSTQRDSVFYDVVAGRGPQRGFVFAVTNRGLLCSFNISSKIMERWIEIKTQRLFSISATDAYVCVSCADGLIRMFNPGTLKYCFTLPRPPPIWSPDERLNDTLPTRGPSEPIHADAVCVRLSNDNTRASVVYSDHSLYVWDMSSSTKIVRYRSMTAHAACVRDIDVIPLSATMDPSCRLAASTFTTCSTDGTVRVWNLDPNAAAVAASTAIPLSPSSSVSGSVDVSASFSRRAPGGPHAVKELLKTLYSLPENFTAAHVGAFLAPRDEDGGTGTSPTGSVQSGVTASASGLATDSNGVRCVRLSPDGHHLASADRQGNIRVYDVTQDFKLVAYLEAHDSEVVTMDFSSVSPDSPHKYLATGGRDRLIHVFDTADYSVLQTLDDHSSSITSVKFAAHGTRLLSCSADKSIVFRSIQTPFKIVRDRLAVGTFHDMEVCPATNKWIVTAGQDKKLNVWDVDGRPRRTLKTDSDTEHTKVEMDPSGIYVATACSDRAIRIYDFISGDCLAMAKGPSEPVTGLKFTTDFQRLISTTSDGCIFVWKLHADLVNPMLDRLSELYPAFAPRASQIRASQQGGLGLGLGLGLPHSHPPAAHQQMPPPPPPITFMPVPPMPAEMAKKPPVSLSQKPPLNDPSLDAEFAMKQLILEEPVESQRPRDSSAILETDSSVQIVFSRTQLPSWAKELDIPKVVKIAPPPLPQPSTAAGAVVSDPSMLPLTAQTAGGGGGSPSNPTASPLVINKLNLELAGKSSIGGEEESGSAREVRSARGRWAQRVDDVPILPQRTEGADQDDEVLLRDSPIPSGSATPIDRPSSPLVTGAPVQLQSTEVLAQAPVVAVQSTGQMPSAAAGGVGLVSVGDLEVDDEEDSESVESEEEAAEDAGVDESFAYEAPPVVEEANFEVVNKVDDVTPRESTGSEGSSAQTFVPGEDDEETFSEAKSPSQFGPNLDLNDSSMAIDSPPRPSNPPSSSASSFVPSTPPFQTPFPIGKISGGGLSPLSPSEYFSQAAAANSPSLRLSMSSLYYHKKVEEKQSGGDVTAEQPPVPTSAPAPVVHNSNSPPVASGVLKASDMPPIRGIVSAPPPPPQSDVFQNNALRNALGDSTEIDAEKLREQVREDQMRIDSASVLNLNEIPSVAPAQPQDLNLPEIGLSSNSTPQPTGLTVETSAQPHVTFATAEESERDAQRLATQHKLRADKEMEQLQQSLSALMELGGDQTATSPSASAPHQPQAPSLPVSSSLEIARVHASFRGRGMEPSLPPPPPPPVSSSIVEHLQKLQGSPTFSASGSPSLGTFSQPQNKMEILTPPTASSSVDLPQQAMAQFDKTIHDLKASVNHSLALLQNATTMYKSLYPSLEASSRLTPPTARDSVTELESASNAMFSALSFMQTRVQQSIHQAFGDVMASSTMMPSQNLSISQSPLMQGSSGISGSFSHLAPTAMADSFRPGATSATNASNIDEALDRYSNILVELVKKKLENGK